MYPVCPPDCLLGLGLVYHWQCCGWRFLIYLISLLVSFLHFAMVQESTVVLNLQIHNGRRDTHAMAQEFQQTHLCGIVELGSDGRVYPACLYHALRRLIVKIEHNQLQKQDLISFITKERNNQISQLSQWNGMDLTTI